MDSIPEDIDIDTPTTEQHHTHHTQHKHKKPNNLPTDSPALKTTLENLAAKALGITPRKLRNNNDKTWLGLGGDSLTAVNFMGACHAAGIRINIPDIVKAESIDDLLRRIAEGHLLRCLHVSGQDEDEEWMDGIANGNGNAKANERDADASMPPPRKRQKTKLDVSSELRGFLNGSIDAVEGVGLCSPMQENFMAVQNLDPSAYQLRVAVTIASTNLNPAVVVSTDAARHAWRRVVRKHPALRTSFIDSVDRPGHLDQIVWRDVEPQISVFSSPSEAEAASFEETYRSKFSHRLVLAPAAFGRLYLRLVISHALVDGVSLELLFRDFLLGLSDSIPEDEEHGSLACDAYIEAQQPDTSQESLKYWSRYTEAIEGTFLKGAIATPVPSKTKKPTGLYVVDDEITILKYDNNRHDELKATVASACQVAWALVLGSYTGNSDVCFSYTASGRQKRVRGLQEGVGNFVNTLPCRINLLSDPTVEGAAQGVQADFLESLHFQGASLSGVQQFGDCLLSFQRGLPEDELMRAGFEVDVLSWEAPSDVS